LILSLVIAFSFIQGGWNDYWGSANGDILDGLVGRDLLLQDTKLFFEQPLGYYRDDPFAWYQYSSLAFLSKLFSTFDRANIFHLQGLFMLYVMLAGTYFLCKSVFRFGEKASLLASVAVTINSLYMSTYYTGHEGSLVFGGLAPVIVGLSLWAIRERQFLSCAGALAFLLYCVLWTYPYPAAFVIVPLILYWVYVAQSYEAHGWLSERFSAIKNQGRALFRSKYRFLLILILLLSCAVLFYLVSQFVWNYFEPIRTNPSGHIRSWGIAHYKEMLLLYWGLAPSSIAFGRVAGILRLYPAVTLFAAYSLSIVYMGLVVAGLWRVHRSGNQFRAFFLGYAFSWVVFFLFMKFVVADSYYFYKFLYTNLFMSVILFVYGALDSDRPGPSNGKTPIWRTALGMSSLIFYLISNAATIGVYNYDLLQRSYNGEKSKRFWDVEPLKSYVARGLMFPYASNNFTSDYGNIISYILGKRGIVTRRPGGQFVYELKYRSLEDIVRHREDSRNSASNPIWQNDVYRVERAPRSDILTPLDRRYRTIADSWYQPERYSYVYNGYPFRWVSYKLEFLLSRPSNTLPLLGLCVEPGPGFDYRPFDLQLQLVRGEKDTSSMNASSVADFSARRSYEEPIATIRVNGLQYTTVKLPRIDSPYAMLRVIALRKGKDMLPWDERYLDYRMAMISLTDAPYDRDVLKLMNQERDIVPPQTWVALSDISSDLDENSDLLCVWNHWGQFEEYSGQRFRWVNNDAQLLLLNPTVEPTYLNLELERGPAFADESVNLQVSLNDSLLTSMPLVGRQSIKEKLPIMQQKENIITLHVNKLGKPLHNDPRILNFRVFKAYLSRD
jgi:hypothetical protein